MEIFRSLIVTWFFASFSSVLDWIVLILVWFERSLHSAKVSGQSCPWLLKLMTSQRVERTWIRTGGYRRFRGQWVNTVFWPSIIESMITFVKFWQEWRIFVGCFSATSPSGLSFSFSFPALYIDVSSFNFCMLADACASSLENFFFNGEKVSSDWLAVLLMPANVFYYP